MSSACCSLRFGVDRSAVIRALFLAGLCLALGAGSTPLAAADPAPLLKYVPPGANALLLMDAAALKKTPLAVRQQWAAKHTAAAKDRPLFLPPEADAIAIAAQLDPTNAMQQQWELAIVSLAQPLSMASIAKSEGGYVETLGGAEAVWTPSEAYFVGLARQTLGVMYPANRQAVSRWAGYAKKSSGSEVSPYLTTAAKRLNANTSIVLALDLLDVVPPHQVHQAVIETDAIKAKPEKREDIARILAGIQGVTFTLEINTSARGTFHFDFSESCEPFVNFAKPLLVEIINRADLSLADVEKWTVDLKGKTATVSGDVPTNSLRRVFSLLEIPTTKFSEVEESDLKSSGADSAAKASVEYFHSVQALIDDLRGTLEDTRDNHAVWMERYARKVDRLPILHVDEELLGWGAAVGETFRAMALAERSGGIRAGVRKSSTYGNYQYQYDGNGYYYDVRSTESVRNQIRAEERGKAKVVRFEKWKDLEDATAAIRKKMTQKHQTEF